MPGRIAAVRRSIVAATVALLLGAGVVIGSPMSTARADSAPLDPANPATPATVSADPLPTVQINGVVWAQVVVGNRVYVTGQFTRARPAGAAPGTAEVVRNNMLAYDIRTGELVTSFAPNLNAQGRTIAASPDGTRIYVGGDFTQANGQARSRVAAYDTATGQLVGTFRPAVSSTVLAIAATNQTVYLGGDFSAVGGTARTRLAAVSAADGSLLPWAPRPGTGPTSGNRNGSTATSNSVLALAITGGGAQVVAGGRFYTMNGALATGVSALDPVTGATRPFAIGQLITNQGVNSAVFSLVTQGDTVYGTAYDYYGPGNIEGSFAVAAAGGALKWANTCLGDTYSAFPMNGALYHATHAHDCSTIGSFAEQNPRVNMFGTAVSLTAAGTTGAAQFGNGAFAGRPAPSALPWWPKLQIGSYTKQYQAGWSVTGNDRYVVYGGEFPGVNSTPQQGLVRFAVPELAPNKVGPAATGFTPTVALISGAVRISWRAVSDRDNEYLTYRVYRDSDTSTPVCETTRSSEWWRLPVIACTDTSAPAGSHRYLVVAGDAFGNNLRSAWVTATVGATNSSTARPYTDVVRADGAQNHWSLGEPSGGLAYDRTGTMDLTVNPGITRGGAGAIAGDTDTAYRFNGTSTGFLAGQTAAAGPQTFSVEAWFQTTSPAGGKIVGYGNARTGTSTSYDRSIYMDTAGRVFFGVHNGAVRSIGTTAALNDGAWHHAVGVLGPNGLAFYVDGVLVGSRADVTSAARYNGYWRVGGDTSWAGGAWFGGAIDEVAVYPTALTGAQVAAHHTAGGTGQAPNVAPTASFDVGTSDLTAFVDGSASSDRDGAVASHAWDFGDGTTATGATAAHTYASAGTYTVTLTVTDDRGATAATTRAVTLTAAPAGPGSVAADAFGRTTDSGWGEADSGGLWTIGGGGANASVTDGSGRLTAAPGRGVTATLSDVSRTDVSVQAEFTLPQAPTGGGTFVTLGGRQIGADGYRTTLVVESTGAMTLRLDRLVGGTETILGTQRLPGSYVPGTSLTVRFEVAGTGTATLRAKAWSTGAAEPAEWTLTRGDDAPQLQWPGALYLRTYASGSATTSSTLHVDNVRAEPPGTVVQQPNSAPTADFTATQAGLSVAFDGSSSTDPDGSIAAHGWAFGDGATATGATATHAYASAGTYTVVLTVTDDGGATATRERTVTVTAPAPDPGTGTPPLAADAFAREVASGWGAADVGGAWTVNGTLSNASVTAGAGQLISAPGRTMRAVLPDVSRQDVAVQVDVMLPQAPSGGGTFVTLGTQRVGTTDYRSTLVFQGTGSVVLRVERTVDGAATVLGSTTLPLRYVPGTSVTVRFETSGTGTTTLRSKVWATGTAEPAEWALTRTDSTAALQRAGAPVLETYASSSATAAATVRIDNLWAGAAGTTPATP